MAVLKETRNVKYGAFVAPGNALRMDIEWLKPTDAGAAFKATGNVISSSGKSSQAVQMRLELAYFNLSDQNPALADLDPRLTEHNRRRWELLAIGDESLGLNAGATEPARL